MALANDFWLGHAQGWHWYHDPRWIKPKKLKQNSIIQSQTQSIVEMSLVQKTVKAALDRAILHPTEKNVKQYIEVQNLINEHSSQFSNIWQNVLVQNPTLDYSVTHPTNQIGKSLYLDLYRRSEHQAIQALAKHYGLFFFFRSTCPYCHRFAPIVRDFSRRYGMSIVPVSLDGRGLPQFPNAKADNGAGRLFHVKVVPALFLVNPKTRQVIPVSYGLMTEQAIANRLYRITKQIKMKPESIGVHT